MEDAVVAEPLDKAGTTYCFAVFDGHGGDHCARWAARELPRRIRAVLNDPDVHVAALPLAELLLGMDEDLRLQPRSWGCGTTAVVLIVTGRGLAVANLGDSRAVLCRSGGAHCLTAAWVTAAPLPPL